MILIQWVYNETEIRETDSFSIGLVGKLVGKSLRKEADCCVVSLGACPFQTNGLLVHKTRYSQNGQL